MTQGRFRSVERAIRTHLSVSREEGCSNCWCSVLRGDAMYVHRSPGVGAGRNEVGGVGKDKREIRVVTRTAVDQPNHLVFDAWRHILSAHPAQGYDHIGAKPPIPPNWTPPSFTGAGPGSHCSR